MKEIILSISIKDCEVQVFRAGGKGGQNQNKVNSGVRVIHRPSGAVGEARDSRDQPQNKQAAFKRMAESKEFKRWLNRQIAEELQGETLEQTVERLMEPENLKIEIRGDHGWETEAP